MGAISSFFYVFGVTWISLGLSAAITSFSLVMERGCMQKKFFVFFAGAIILTGLGLLSWILPFYLYQSRDRPNA